MQQEFRAPQVGQMRRGELCSSNTSESREWSKNPGGESSVLFVYVFGTTFSGIEEEGVLPDVESRAPARASEEGSKADGLDERNGASEAGAGRR